MDLQELREQIDALDDQIVALINERCKIASKVGEWKKKRAHAIYVPEREKQLFERLHGKNEGPISSSALRSIYREIISGAIALEKPLKIICLQSPVNAANAARETFGDSAEYSRLESVAELLEKLNSDDFDYGVIPLADKSENFEEKAIAELLKHQDIKICAERIGSIDNTGGTYYIIGPQETTPSREDRTAIAIKLNSPDDEWSTELKKFEPDMKIFTAFELTSNSPTVFVEFAGHPAEEKTKNLLSELEKIGEVQILGGYPVLYA